MQTKKLTFVVATSFLIVLAFIVSYAQAGQVQLSWKAPTTDANGTPLTDLAGYNVYYGQMSGQYPVTLDVGLATSAAISGLTSGQTYYFAVTAYDTSGNESAFSTEAVYTVPAANTDVVFAVNAGGPAYTANDGTVYQADTGYSGGTTYTTSASMAGTTDDPLYQSERYGNFTYNIPVSNGAYVVTLKFAETYWTAAGQRVFDVLIEGREVLSNLDLYARVGRNTAYDVAIPVTVSDGVLNLVFHTDQNNAKVNAILVKRSTAPVNTKVVFAVNPGGPAYTASDGTVYQADTRYSGGSTYTTNASMAGTTDDPLYQSERYGNFTYNIPVSNGSYTVTLKFAEIYWAAAGQRVFDVLIEGREVISNLDLYARVGRNTAYDVAIPVTVSDGVLNLVFRTDRDQATVSAILVTGAQ